MRDVQRCTKFLKLHVQFNDADKAIIEETSV